MSNDQSRTIVVGVDGSPAGDRALRWAIRQAAKEGSRVTAVTVRLTDDLLPGTSFALQPHGRRPAESVAAEHEQLAKIVAEARGHAENPPAVRESVVTGDPATELASAARGAEMLVVGSHGHGAVAEILLGSVAADCVRQSHCPVVVITPNTPD